MDGDRVRIHGEALYKSTFTLPYLSSAAIEQETLLSGLFIDAVIISSSSTPLLKLFCFGAFQKFICIL